MNVKIIANHIKQNIEFDGGVAVILGSGLDEFGNYLKDKKRIAYSDIPNYPSTSVPGHKGEFIVGELYGKSIIAARGRFHYYEGFDWDTIVLPVKLFYELNVRTVIITNSAGSMRKAIRPGDLILINGYLDCTFRKSVKDPEVISIVHNQNSIKNKLLEKNIKFKEGVYCWALGPSYETPAEIKYFKSLGGDIVGMSTVPELIKAKELGMAAFGISCATNFAEGMSESILTHEEVLETANKTKDNFINMLKIILKEI